MLKPAYQVSILYPYVHPEQEINQRHRPTRLRNQNKTREALWEFDPNPYH